MKMTALPACPRGNSASFKILLRDYGVDTLWGAEFAFIVNRDLTGKISPAIFIRWPYEEAPPEPFDSVYVNYDEEAADDCIDCEGECARALYTYLLIPSGATASLDPGAYYFNVNLFNPYRQNYTKTILAGTWPILPVPGLMSASQKYPGTWHPQLFDQFPPRVPRRFYAY